MKTITIMICSDCPYCEDKAEASYPEFFCKKLNRFKMCKELQPPGDCPLGNSREDIEKHKCSEPSSSVASLRDLKRGMIVRSRSGGKAWIVDANYGDRVTAVSSMDITNIDEWDIVGQQGENMKL